MIDCLENIDSIPCYGYGIYYKNECIHLSYPKVKNDIPHQGRSFHHGRFIMNLRRAVSRVPKYVSLLLLQYIFLRSIISMSPEVT